MNGKQSQKAGDNSQQMQVENIIVNGISEERVREICHEVADRAIADNTHEANDVATKKIERFVDLLLPRIQRIENNYQSFSDPAFQVLLRKAQLTAACTEREDDYKLLSELLVHRIKNKSNIKKKASISKAVEIIDQIDDDSLCGLTLFHAMSSFVPVTGEITEGVSVLADLYSKLNPDCLPTDNSWIDNLSILGAATTIHFSEVKKFEDYLSSRLDGYVCVGIKKDSPEYSIALEKLSLYKLEQMIGNNELLDGYVRLLVAYKSQIHTPHFFSNELIDGKMQQVEQQLSDVQKQCLSDIFDMYSKDQNLKKKVIATFKQSLNSFDSIKKVCTWWNSINLDVDLTSIGKIIAHANAKRVDDTLPDLD